jgi:aminodeoxyfutalosine synthase
MNMTELEITAAIAERAREGGELTEAELVALDAADVLSLGMLADEVRRARVGDTVAFARVLEVGPDGLGDDDATAAALGAADEIRLSAPAGTLADTVTAVRDVRARAGEGRRITGFSLAEVAARQWGPLPAVLAALKEAGLDAIAEAPADLISAEEVGAAIAAGLGPATLSVQQWSAEGRVPLITRVRSLVAAHPALGRFNPLARVQSVSLPTTGYQDVRLVALARIALPSVAEIEVDWQQYGPKLAQVALMFGCNRLDRVSPVDDPALGPRRATVEEVRRSIMAAGFRPAAPGEAA